MPDLSGWPQSDRAILADSPTFRARFRQVLVQAAININSEPDPVDDPLEPAPAEVSPRKQLARSVVHSPDTYAQTMVSAVAVHLAGTDDNSILGAIAGIWDTFTN